MIDRETPYLKYVFEAAGDISHVYQSSVTSATPVVSTGMAHVTRLALSILVARHRTNLKLIPACCKDMYVNTASSINSPRTILIFTPDRHR